MVWVSGPWVTPKDKHDKLKGCRKNRANIFGLHMYLVLKLLKVACCITEVISYLLHVHVHVFLFLENSAVLSQLLKVPWQKKLC